MNKKTQFFIVSTVIISMALTTIIYLLTIPGELSRKDIQGQLRDYDDFYSGLKTLRQLSMSIHDYWPKSHPNRLGFELTNLGSKDATNQVFLLNFEVDDSAVKESFYLIRGGEKLAFSASQVSAKNYLLSFKDSVSRGSSNEYYLFFNKLSDTSAYLKEDEKISDYYETSQAINYESSTYKAMLNKSSGEVLSVKLSGNGYELGSLQAASNNNLQSGCTANYSFTSYSNNVLSVNFTCMLGTVTLVQNYEFHPDFFLVSQDFSVLYFGSYNLSLTAITSLNSLASSVGVYEPLSQPALTLHDSKYASLFYQDYGALFIGNDSAPHLITSPNITMHYRINSSSFNSGTYSQKIIIMPYYNDYNYSLIAADNYFNNPINRRSMEKNEFLSYFKLSFLNLLSNSFNSMFFFINTTRSNNMITSISREPSYSPREFTITHKELFNKSLLQASGKELSYSLTTDNYHRNSSIPYYLTNNESLGVLNTTYEFAKLSGSQITAIINTTGPINVKILDYLSQLIYDNNISSDAVISLESNISGIFKIVISNESALFKVSVNQPIISVNSPIILNSSGNSELFFKTDSSFNLNKTNLIGSAMAVLSSSISVLINESGNFSYESGNNHYSKANYYLNVSSGKTFIDNGLNFGAKNSYLSGDYEINGMIFKNFNALEYYRINNSAPNNYCALSYNNSVINNTAYSIDFANNGFIIDSINWSSSELFSIDSSAFSFSGLILDSCLMNSFQFDSANASMILTALNDSKLFIINFENVKKIFDFKVNLRISGDADNYYNFNSETGYFAASKIIGSKSLNLGYNFIAKNDSGTFAAIIFKADDLMQSSSSIIAHNDYLQISLSKFCKKVYLYITDDLNELIKMSSELGNEITVSDELLTYNYYYTSQRFKSSGTILG